MSNITAPVLEIRNRLHHHREVGYGDPVVKILDGLKIYDTPTDRNQEEEDLPNIVLDIPQMAGGVEQHMAAFGECEQVIELNVSKDKGIIGVGGSSLLEWTDKVITALLRDSSGNPDHYLGGKVTKQIVISFSDGIPSELSLTLPITVRWRTKAYR